MNRTCLLQQIRKVVLSVCDKEQPLLSPALAFVSIQGTLKGLEYIL